MTQTNHKSSKVTYKLLPSSFTITNRQYTGGLTGGRGLTPQQRPAYKVKTIFFEKRTFLEKHALFLYKSITFSCKKTF